MAAEAIAAIALVVCCDLKRAVRSMYFFRNLLIFADLEKVVVKNSNFMCTSHTHYYRVQNKHNSPFGHTESSECL